MQKHTSIKTGWKTFDNNHGPLKRGDLMVVASTGSSGASTSALTLARNAAFGKHKVLFVSFECGNSEFQQSWTSCVTNVPLESIRVGDIVESQLCLCRRLDMCAAPFTFLSGDSKLSLEKLLTAAANNHFDLVVIDRIGDLEASGDFKSETSRLGHVAKALKRFALKHGCVVAVTTHLDDRTHDIISEKQLKDIADIVLSWHTSEENIMDGHVPVYVAKSRHSRPGFTFHLSTEFHIQQMNDVTSRVLHTNSLTQPTQTMKKRTEQCHTRSTTNPNCPTASRRAYGSTATR